MVVDLRGAVRFAQHDLPLTHDRHKAGKRRDALHGRKLCLSLCVETFRISITNAAKTVRLKSPFLSLPLCRLGHLASLATSSPSSSLTLALTVMDGGRRPVNAYTGFSAQLLNHAFAQSSLSFQPPPPSPSCATVSHFLLLIAPPRCVYCSLPAIYPRHRYHHHLLSVPLR